MVTLRRCGALAFSMHRHGIDHDDGSMSWNDVENVVAFSHACKGNFGSNRNCSANLVLAPGLKDVFKTTATAGAPCGEETNNGHGSTFANKYVWAWAARTLRGGRSDGSGRLAGLSGTTRHPLLGARGMLPGPLRGHGGVGEHPAAHRAGR